MAFVDNNNKRRTDPTYWTYEIDINIPVTVSFCKEHGPKFRKQCNNKCTHIKAYAMITHYLPNKLAYSISIYEPYDKYLLTYRVRHEDLKKLV